MKAVEHCENCGRAIGKLEQPYVWRKHLVCAECHVHLSTPAPASAASRPSQAPAPLPPREHYHAPRPPTPRPGGAAPAPVALQPDTPAPHAAPMLLCAACGHAYAFNDVVSDHGKVICRNCALAAAAQKAKTAARDKRVSILKKVAVTAVVLLVAGGGAYTTWAIIRARPDRVLTDAINGTPRSPDAAAEQIMKSGQASNAGAPDTAPASPEPESADAAAPKTLFPPPDALPDTGAGGTSISLAPATGTGTIVTAPAPRDPPPPEQGSSLADLVRRDAAQNGRAQAPQPEALPAGTGRPVTGTEVPAPERSPERSPRRRPPPPPEGTVDWFVHEGTELLAAGRYHLSLEQFNLAMKKDRNHPDAWHGAGLSLLGMGDRAAALERLEKAVTLYDPPSRAAVFNCAVLNLRENPMRAAKIIKEFLARDDGTGAPGQDEAMHALMGKALFSVGRQGRQNKVYADAQDFYFAYNEQLESRRTDNRGRWGSEWVPRREAAQKWNRYRSRQQNVETLRTSVDRATKAKKDAWDKLYDQRTGMRLIGDREQREGEQRYKQAANQELELRAKLKTAETEFNSAEKPPFPQAFKPLPMDEPRRSPGTAAR